MQERTRELELNYRRYLRRKRIKTLFSIMFCFFALLGSYFGVLFYQNQNKLLTQALEEKRDLEKRLQLAKVNQEKNKVFREKTEKELKLSEQDKEKSSKANRIQITSISLNVKLLKKAFYQNPSLEKALSMSKIYYENKDYKKSIFWALKANEFDKSSQESWILFAKAKEALGEIQEAQEVMESWKKHYGFLGNEK